MLPIGDFSKICNVTTKTLRYYDEIGLIKPAVVNEHNGYRSYDIKQLETMLFINKLKLYGFSLEEIAEVLNDEGENKLSCLIRKKQKLLQDKLDNCKYLLCQIDKDILNLERGIPIMAYLDHIKVELIETTGKNILCSRQRMSIEEYCIYFGKLFERIAKENLTCVGAPIAIYHDKEFDPVSNDTEIAVPIAEKVGGARELTGGLCVKGVHKGPYSELPSAYAKIVQWMATENYTLVAPPYEIYVTNPAETTVPEDNITEIYFPVKK